MAESQLKRRLKMLLSEKHFSLAEYARCCGLSVSYVNSVKTSLSFDVLTATVKLFPDVNLNWLVLGAPPMLNTAVSELETAKKEIALLREKVAMQEKIITLYERHETEQNTPEE